MLVTGNHPRENLLDLENFPFNHSSRGIIIGPLAFEMLSMLLACLGDARARVGRYIQSVFWDSRSWKAEQCVLCYGQATESLSLFSNVMSMH